MKRLMYRVLAVLLCTAMLFAVTGCRATPLRASVEYAGSGSGTATGMAADSAFTGSAADFSLQLFQTALQKDNCMVSPLSVLLALAMTQNGAAGRTLAQMQQTLGGLPRQELNRYLLAYMQSLPCTDKAKFSAANSIWTKTGTIEPNADFLQANADFFGAQVYASDFTPDTVQDMNSWVKTHTDGMIDSIVDEIPPTAVLYLLNALVFDAQWQKQYEDVSVQPAQFANYDGTVGTVEMMYGQETDYLQDENARGFMKNYAGGAYAFVALLPDENTDVLSYARQLTGEKFLQLVQNPKQALVQTGLPKFSAAYSASLNENLQQLGMTDAFDPNAADFSSMGKTAQPLYIGDVLHKTYIEVSQSGTRAAAVTAVMMECGAACAPQYETVVLDRPFVYAIVDTATGLPLFMGVQLQFS